MGVGLQAVPADGSVESGEVVAQLWGEGGAGAADRPKGGGHAAADAHDVANVEGRLAAGHAGAASGGKHFIVRIASPLFVGASRVARQRMVMAAAGDLMRAEIHALSVEACTPEDV